MLQTQNTYLRLVNVDDAEFILSLRQNQNLNQFLSAVSPDIQMQRDWIISYKLREEQGLDYYFIVMDKRFEAVGMVRVYDINYENKSFTWGSWVLSENRPKYTALDSMILSYDFAFNELGLGLCQFKVHTANKRAKQFYERFGSKIIHQDDIETFFELTKLQYLQLKYNQYYKFLLN